jgi:hypothetical protein
MLLCPCLWLSIHDCPFCVMFCFVCVLCPMLPVSLVIHSWLSLLCYVLFCLCLVPNVACVSGSNMVKMVEHQYCIVIWKIRKMNRVRSDMDSQHDNVTIVYTEHNNWQQKVNLVFRLWHTQTCSIVLGEISKTSTPFNIDWFQCCPCLWLSILDCPFCVMFCFVCVLCPMLPVSLVVHSWLSLLCYVLFCLCLVTSKETQFLCYCESE